MKFGVREICDVVLKAKANQKVGNKIFYKNEPVIYFDTLKTSSMEGAATTVYAQGGRGNSRLVAWEGERTVTFTMEDALISPAGFMILSGAGLIEATEENTIKVHTTEQTNDVEVKEGKVTITLKEAPYAPTSTTTDGATVTDTSYIYVMLMNNGEVVSEPYIPAEVTGNTITLKAGDDLTAGAAESWTEGFVTNGVDMPAEFIIPNCKIQSNFTFTMASSGDPSTFTFTMDAFPDYTRFDNSKKVLAAIQIISDTIGDKVLTREKTQTERIANDSGFIVEA